MLSVAAITGCQKLESVLSSVFIDASCIRCWAKNKQCVALRRALAGSARHGIATVCKSASKRSAPAETPGISKRHAGPLGGAGLVRGHRCGHQWSRRDRRQARDAAAPTVQPHARALTRRSLVLNRDRGPTSLTGRTKKNNHRHEGGRQPRHARRYRMGRV